jgi:hypothetical protein
MDLNGRSYAVLLALQPGVVPVAKGQFHYSLFTIVLNL